MSASDWNLLSLPLTYVWHKTDIIWQWVLWKYKHDFDPECDLSAFLTLTSESGLSDFDVNAWIKAVILIPN